MIIRGKPTCLEDYLVVKEEESNKLHKAGYQPEYMDNQFFYYRKTENLLKNLQKIIDGGGDG